MSAFPEVLYVLAVAAMCEVAGWMLRRKGHAHAGRYLAWAARPFGLWALIGAYYELQPWTAFKRLPWVAFPVYATPRVELAAGWEWRAALALAAAAAGIVVVRLALRRPSLRRWPVLLLAVCFGVNTAVALLPGEWPGVLYPWKLPYKVYAYSADRIESPARFMREFNEIHESLDLHARSHPPGAMLLSWWTKNTETPAVPENALVQLALASLLIPVTWALARELSSPRIAIAATAFVGLMPAAAWFGTFSLDPVFAVVLNLGLLFAARLAHGRRLITNATAAGATFAAASMLQFSWPVVAAAACLYGVAAGKANGLSARALAARALVPLLVLAGVHGVFMLVCGFDYIEAFATAWKFHHGFYRLRTLHDAALAVIASPSDLLMGAGPLAAAAAVAAIGRGGRGLASSVRLFAAAVLVAYGLPLLFGPGSMKFETARTWNWVLPTVAILAAAELDRRHPIDDRPFLFTAAASVLTAAVLLCLFNFGR